MQLKMYEILELSNLYNSISNIKLPIKTTYKFAKLMRQVEQEINFYQTKFREIVEEYGVKENGQYKFTADGTSIEILPGKENECNSKIAELRNLDITVDEIKFSIDELSSIDISLSDLSCLMPLIED